MSNNGIYTVDAEYGRKNLAAVYIIVHNGKAAIIETANASSLQLVIKKLHELGLNSADVELIFVTHVHLDHAGGAGAYMEEFANAKLVVHPKGVRHMLDPSKLEESVRAVYGDIFVDQMYGKLQKIPESRIIIGSDQLKLNLHGRILECRDTPGHANHHNIIIDHLEKVIFTGDIFGVGYPELLDSEGRQLVYPTTSPVNFNPEKMLSSINLIELLAPERVYLTHFDVQYNIVDIAEQLRNNLARYLVIAREVQLLPDRVKVLQNKFLQDFINVAKERGCKLSAQEISELISIDMNLNAQGFDVWLNQVDH